MTDDAFIQAIIADPDDDHLRLVYADFLDEKGDPRGEFIRVQCQLAKLPEYDPRREELEAREKQLLDDHTDAWLGPLRSLVPDQHDRPGYRFRRGFVDEICVLATDFVQHAETIFGANPVRRTTLRAAGDEITRLADCPYLFHLADLDLEFWDDAYFPVQGFRALLISENLVRLRGLGVSGSDMGTAGAAALAISPLLGHLQRLDLGASHLTAKAMRILTRSSSLRGLTDLDVGNNGIGLRGVWALAGCPHLAGLTRLGLGFTYIGVGCGIALAASSYLARLTDLSLSESDLGDGGLQALSTSPNLSQLKVLWLDGNDLTAEGVRALANSSSIRQLTELVVFDNPIGDEGVRWLAGSRSLTELTDLCLGNCGVSDVGAQALATTRKLPRLRRLGLWSTGNGLANSIGDEGAEALAAAPHLHQLVWLNLRGNRLTDHGKQVLRARFGDRVQF